MTFAEVLEHLKFEYHSYLAAVASSNEWRAQTGDRCLGAPMAFYDFLLAQGYNRWQLSAHGIGRDIEA